MKTFRKIMHLVPIMLFWLMMTAFVWSWIFTFLTDAPREEKIVLFIECDVPGDTFIASKLEEAPSDLIRLSCGLENYNDLISDIAAALSEI